MHRRLGHTGFAAFEYKAVEQCMAAAVGNNEPAHRSWERSLAEAWQGPVGVRYAVPNATAAVAAEGIGRAVSGMGWQEAAVDRILAGHNRCRSPNVKRRGTRHDRSHHVLGHYSHRAVKQAAVAAVAADTGHMRPGMQPAGWLEEPVPAEGEAVRSCTPL